jgi:hypothetical protein
MDNFEGLFANIHQPMKHSYILLEFWSHENIYNVWFFWTQTLNAWGNMTNSIKIWMNLIKASF